MQYSLDRVTAAVRRSDGTVDESVVGRDPVNELYVVADAEPGDDIMLRINDRWVGRWFAGER